MLQTTVDGFNLFGPAALGLGVGLTLHHKHKNVMKLFNEPQTWTDSLGKQSEIWNMDMRFGNWNIRSLYRANSLMTVLEELSKYKLDLVGVQQIRWQGGSTKPADEYTLFYRKGNENHELGTGLFCA
jgi:hypothetical protein